MTSKTKVHHRFDLPPQVQLKAGKKPRTKQSFRDECDINKIMAKFQKTGAISHIRQHGQNYGFASSNDFAKSMRIVIQAKEMFAELPSSIRNRFANQPEHFLQFVQDPANADEMVTMGLMTPKSEAPPAEVLPPPAVAPKPSAEPPEGTKDGKSAS